MPNTETFAANQGQIRSRGFAVRSDSAMISMPAVSMTPRPPIGAVAGRFSDEVMATPGRRGPAGPEW